MATEKDYNKIALELAVRLIWALKYMKPKSGGGSVLHIDTMVAQPWDEWFMDGLDAVGYKIDRKKYRARMDGKKPRTKKVRRG